MLLKGYSMNFLKILQNNLVYLNNIEYNLA